MYPVAPARLKRSLTTMIYMLRWSTHRLLAVELRALEDSVPLLVALEA
jgi:hypothetical protein